MEERRRASNAEKKNTRHSRILCARLSRIVHSPSRRMFECETKSLNIEHARFFFDEAQTEGNPQMNYCAGNVSEYLHENL